MARHTTGIVRAHWKGGGGRPVVALASNGVHSTLKDMQSQLIDLQEKVATLMHYVEEDKVVGLGYAVRNDIGPNKHIVAENQVGLQPVGINKDPRDPT